MLHSIPVPDIRNLDDYRESAGEEAVERLRAAADPLKGTRLIHISSTSFGGGVAELLPTQIAILRDLGIDAEWQLIEGSESFFTITKLVHNACQGAEVIWTDTMQAGYLERVRENAERFVPDGDFFFVHDPQPMAILSFVEDRGERRGNWVWRCHIDLSQPDPEVWTFFGGLVARFDAAVFTVGEFVPPGLQIPARLIPPSIDPLSTKNAWLPHETVYEILSTYGIEVQRPLITQVSRFDPWKDPLGVIDAYRLAKRDVPDLQLALVGAMAHDDPEAWHYLERSEAHREGDPDVHLLTNLQGVGPLDVNALQRASTAIVQKSIREGFGLTVSEAMWKEKPVVAGDTGGLRLQVVDSETGFLVRSAEECAERVVALATDRELRGAMGRAGRERVRERFLTVREVTDYLNLLQSL